MSIKEVAHEPNVGPSCQRRNESATVFSFDGQSTNDASPGWITDYQQLLARSAQSAESRNLFGDFTRRTGLGRSHMFLVGTLAAAIRRDDVANERLPSSSEFDGVDKKLARLNCIHQRGRQNR